MKNKRFWLSACLSSLLLVACGGGDTEGIGAQSKGGVGTGGTGSYANGPITDFGSIVVNGIHFDHTKAKLIQRADEPSTLLLPDALKRGMMVELEGKPVESHAGRREADAITIRITSQLRGKLERIDDEGQRLHILGQVVQITPDTWFDTALPDRLQSLLAGQTVEIYGFFDAQSNNYVATRVDTVSNTDAPSVVQGIVTDLDPAGRWCRIGRSAYVLESASPDLPIGKLARIKVSGVLPPTGTGDVGPAGATDNIHTWTVYATVTRPTSDGGTKAYLDGLVTAVNESDKKRFSVNGLEIDASAISCPVCTTMQLGDRISVSGMLASDVVLADEVTQGTP